ncbi:hypothetical protein PCANC_04066 [Puccinia coronata f. sp. avenae]|uniref:Uncharacterized protein n=1 Tax=Puccinia coronata f. sp. avenae TaxID=200324 RepID=A0A2N5W2A1_9BASI|nr:hypothetical protein PCANC_04066 [Puccinia coronata f. sp. avenae]
MWPIWEIGTNKAHPNDNAGHYTASNAGLDGCIRVYIGCSHPIQTRAPGHQVNQEPIQTRWPNSRATEFELVNDSLGGPAPEFESDGRIRYKLGCNHPSQLFWQCYFSVTSALHDLYNLFGHCN